MSDNRSHLHSPDDKFNNFMLISLFIKTNDELSADWISASPSSSEFQRHYFFILQSEANRTSNRICCRAVWSYRWQWMDPPDTQRLWTSFTPSLSSANVSNAAIECRPPPLSHHLFWAPKPMLSPSDAHKSENTGGSEKYWGHDLPQSKPIFPWTSCTHHIWNFKSTQLLLLIDSTFSRFVFYILGDIYTKDGEQVSTSCHCVKIKCCWRRLESRI